MQIISESDIHGHSFKDWAIKTQDIKKGLKFSCKINVGFVDVSAAPIIQFTEILHNVNHCLSFGLWDKTYQKGSTDKDQEAELAKSILWKRERQQKT